MRENPKLDCRVINIYGEKTVKDKKGLYYYPFPGNKQIRTYVRESEGDIWFRLWSKEDPGLWMEHGWVPYGAIKRATGMFKRGSFDPDQAYDIRVAKALVEESGSS